MAMGNEKENENEKEYGNGNDNCNGNGNGNGEREREMTWKFREVVVGLFFWFAIHDISRWKGSTQTEAPYSKRRVWN